MDSVAPSLATSRRNRMIAVAAGVITVTAIVIASGAEYLHAPWPWLRPAVELLLLAELVGLVVLERHQLFEPVHEKVSGMESHLADIRAKLSLVAAAK
jgi:ABC-type transport system involved in cytochrome c biogenesis permease subunit